MKKRGKDKKKMKRWRWELEGDKESGDPQVMNKEKDKVMNKEIRN